MHTKTIRLIVIICLLFSPLHFIAEANEEMSLEELRALLQKGLTIYEIDQEIIRLNEREKQTMQDIIEVEHTIEKQKQLVASMKERVGRILRSYYTGERGSLIFYVLSMNTLSEALTMIEFINQIFKNDAKRIDDYKAAMEGLEQLHLQLTDTQASLQDIKQQFLLQREQLVTLQEELDQELLLKEQEEAQRAMQLIAELTTEWQNKGLPLFRTYFEALADAMQDLPEIQQLYDNIITFQGTRILFSMTDEQLNGFLAYKDPLFEHLAFTFYEDRIEAIGKQDQVEVVFKGHYSIENEPRNVIRLHLEELLYNGFDLPETTKSALAEEFNLGFYPDMMSFLGLKLQATELHTTSGKMQLKLGFTR